ncbi:MAG: hypothetical protein KC940_09455 [Candidatus Omnitrophica bacterium]|nr:hypothetical protein [Candidatus Omnitrophota bacterium]
MNRNLLLAIVSFTAVAIGLALFVGTGFLVGFSTQSAQYRIIDLGVGETPTCAVSINDSGQILLWETRHVDHVITYGEQPMEMRAWVREPDGTLREIPGLGGKWVHPREINSRGAVIGEAETPDGKPHGFIWEGTGEPKDLGELGFDLPYAEIHCWDDSGRFGGMYYQPQNRSGQKVFSTVPRVWDAEGGVAVEFKNGDCVVDLNNEGSALIDHGSSFEGQIVSASGEETSLGGFAHQGSRPRGMNDRGEVVGYSSITSTLQGTLDGIWGAIKNRRASIQWDERPHAFLWKGGDMVDLNALIGSNEGWELIWAFAINNQGEIVGGGRKDGKVRAFLLKPIQEK